MSKRKRAFTLTELLVVVVVIGVLAATALPKFNRILETRRTTEAESLMIAVRTEQEKRCTFEKPYAGTFKHIGHILSGVPSASSTTTMGNYTYSLGEQGITAASRGKEYSLQIPSYKDGRLCCAGAYCDSLNKDYPKCEALSVDTEPSCGVPACELDSASCACNPEQCKCPAYAAANCTCTGTCHIACSGSNTQSCNGCGTQSRTCNTSNGTWSGWGTCSVNSASLCPGSECTNGQTKGSQICNRCGTQAIQQCVNGHWINSLGACSVSSESQCAEECSVGQMRGSQTCNNCGRQTVEKCVNGTWVNSLGTCTVASTDECPGSECTNGKTKGSQTCHTCGQQTTKKCVDGRWQDILGVCSIASASECPGNECTEGDVSGTKTCNTCGTQTTQKCISGKWASSLGECSKTLQECGIECEAGEKKEEGTCGRCGTQTWVCNSKNKWAMYSCLNQGECVAGSTQGYGCFHWGVQTCNADCTWGEKHCNTEEANQFRKNCNKAGKKHHNYTWDEAGCNCMSCKGFVRITQQGSSFSCADGSAASCVQVWNIF